eukprot:14710250-Ditylum_brightwellii.AAC.1
MDPSTGVAMIGSTDHWPEGIDMVQIEWKDDNGLSHKYSLNKSLYFPESPVNIVSVTLLVEQLNDNKGTLLQLNDNIQCSLGMLQIIVNHATFTTFTSRNLD